ncbi:Hpt sensor hybrid histidine kinase [Sulfurisoma sediminicola]|uniref:Virulence sensor protein BvgS n=2 Tax=Sulfurisoma sediminicola TaxID=1381557 RepID=A0A497XLJ5_9PROT|nr:Hpt sensor hybrid histidine kinase [Sulfurisoma sediminicola]
MMEVLKPRDHSPRLGDRLLGISGTIQQRLMRFALIVAGSALLASAALITTTEVLQEQRNLVGNLGALMNLTAEYSQPYLVFNDQRGGRVQLESLLKRQDILGARLLRPDGSELAVVTRVLQPWPQMTPLDMQPPPRWLLGSSVQLRQVVMLDKEMLGYLEVHVSLEPMWAELWTNQAWYVLALLLGLAVSSMIAGRMRRFITAPIAELDRTAEAITVSRQYGLRVNKTSDDEIGHLIDRFNAMLAQIELSDTELRRHRDELEAKVTERTADLRMALAVAEEASSAKTQFLANMSHEIRTPMNGVLGLAQLLLASELSARQREYVEALQHAGEGLLSLLNDVLDFARGESGRIRLEDIPFDLPGTVHEVGFLFSQRAQEKGIRFDCDVAPDVPRFVHGDPLRLRQILSNLVSNAIKFTDNGGVVVRVDARGGDSSGRTRLVFEVIDTGIGIAVEARDRMFAAFSQADDSMSRRFGGSGLGLAICKQLTDLMGGEISLRGRADGGSIFTVVLPFALAAAPGAARSAPEPTAVGAMRVLLVEDNPTNRLVAQAMLEELGGVSVITAYDGMGALEAFRDADLILMDCQMPRLDGYEATRQIREIEHAEGRVPIPIVALTAHALDEERRRCFEVGMNDFLVKPVLLGDLAATLHRHLPDAVIVTPAASARPLPPAAAVAAEVEAEQAPMLDPTRIEDLLASLPGQPQAVFLQRILETFRRTLDTSLTRLQQVDASDLETVRRAAHTLKSAAAQVGAMRLSHTARELEFAARDGNLQRMVALAAYLPAVANLSWQQLKERYPG